MITFQDSYEEVQSFTSDSGTTATAKHKLRLNHAYNLVLRKFNKRTEGTDTTIASIQSYELPYNFNKLTSVKVTIDNIDYPLTEITNEDDWNLINAQGANFTSDVQTHYYLKDNNILLYPIPASDGNIITYYYSLMDKDLSQDNYTTGTITTLPYKVDFTLAPEEEDVSATLASAWTLPTGVYQVIFDNGDVRNVTFTITKTTATWSTALTADCDDVTVTVNNTNGGSIVIGDSTTWTQAMVGRWFKTDDGYWYRVYSYLSATAITLEKAYAGTAISTGTSTFIIAEMMEVPEEYKYLPIYYATMLYFLADKRDAQMAKMYNDLWLLGYKNIKPELQDDTNIIVGNSRATLRNPNDYPQI